MTASRRFPKNVVAAIRDGQIIGLRAGTEPHRFIGIWAVVVDGRVFVRSWSLARRSWYTTFREDPQGTIRAAGGELRVRAVTSVSEKTKAAVDAAYAEKYDTPGAIRYVKGFKRSKRRRDTTTELLPR